jgi:YidC/Oxa1 family membrane protein insertase
LLKILKNFFETIKSFIEFNNLEIKSKKISFYAEDKQSQNFLLDLVLELTKNHCQEVCYLTSDPKDSIFEVAKNNDMLSVFYIGSGLIRTWMFLNLKTDLLILTMPDLENFHLKKSKIYKVHYLYIFHALVSTHLIYRKGAFDAYNTIFCNNEQQITEIRKTEEIYNLPKKNLFRDGYRPLEFLISENEAYKVARDKHKKIKILIAPTWGENNIFNHCIDELLKNLVISDYEIHLRPHPMTLRNNYSQIQELKKRYSSNNNFILNEDHVDRKILFESDILITDWSGVGIEYGLGLLKPVIYIDTPKKNLNPEYRRINITPIEIGIRAKIGKILNIRELSSIEEIISETIKTYNKNKVSILRDKFVFMKDNGLYKSAKKVISIANSNHSRNIGH